jgi:hypothetical protein
VVCQTYRRRLRHLIFQHRRDATDRRYERVDITGLTGVTAAQRVSLLALGAIEPGQATGVSHGVPLSHTVSRST